MSCSSDNYPLVSQWQEAKGFRGITKSQDQFSTGSEGFHWLSKDDSSHSHIFLQVISIFFLGTTEMYLHFVVSDKFVPSPNAQESKIIPRRCNEINKRKIFHLQNVGFSELGQSSMVRKRQ
ncbi:hypothetical protein AVEN_272984-1 [Araneus ventricosus]|uniref:Uncharacterized protein n=1 Tax=Araneus ventricosus TaxID=182803 RepID=A0A4Y2IEZ6_ARAVE|nr:hypothetical protein AVEN_272984-1 [Araneus ventricosus]